MIKLLNISGFSIFLPIFNALFNHNLTIIRTTHNIQIPTIMKRKTLLIAFLICMMVSLIAISNMQAQTFQLNGDTIDLMPGIPATYNLLANDVIPQGDSIIAQGGNSTLGSVTATHSGGNFTFTANASGNNVGAPALQHGTYRVIDFTLDSMAVGQLVFRIRDRSYDSLYMNNINARFNACGNHFVGMNSPPKFEVPKFSGKATIFSNALWIGGLDNNSTLHLAAERYRQGPNTAPAWTKADYWPGPVMDSAAYSINQDTLWSRIWNLKKSDIEYHKTHYNQTGYVPIPDILQWPGNGNVSLGQATQLAPYFDLNNDGHYNAMDGDYPLIRGDQALFFIFNDDRNYHSESQGNKLKAEIHGMAYVFDIPSDSAFFNTVFLNYKIYNRSSSTYSNTYFGLFTDLDIGYSTDDYIGCDVNRGFYYGYNGTPVDGNGQPEAYGEHPPAQAVTILGGPLLDPDSNDNPSYNGDGISGPSFHGSCDIVPLNGTFLEMSYGIDTSQTGNFLVRSEAINGVGFGDGIVDNERAGMQRFIKTNNANSGVPAYMQDPAYALDYYLCLQGRWNDSTRMFYGGNGHAGFGGYGPECNFMFPGLSDLCDWGTAGQIPNGPKEWTEKTAANPPGDRRGVCSMGPVTFTPGAVQELDIAFTFARENSGRDTVSSLAKLLNMTDVIKHAYVTNTLPNGESFNDVSGRNEISSLIVSVYPNPATNMVTIEAGKTSKETATVSLISTEGVTMMSKVIQPGMKSTKIDVSGVPQGIYIISVRTDKGAVTKKVSIIR